MRPPHAAVLTGDGLGAVAVVRVWGEGAVKLVDSIFRPVTGLSLAATAAGRPRIGRVGAGLGDEVVALVLAGDIESVEIHCHGGPAARSLVMEATLSSGAVQGMPIDMVHAETVSTIRLEAWRDLPNATTLRAASHLLDQATGAFDFELRRIREELQTDPESARSRIEGLLTVADFGTKLVSGWRVVLAGRPNVGKSRLLNALAGFDRAIVDPSPGTTRDVVSIRTAFQGWPVELADTAGLRETEDPIEAWGMAMARSRQVSADLVILVLDRSMLLSDQDRGLKLTHPKAIVVANKCDLPACWEFDGLTVSAESGDGIAGLAEEIGRRLVPRPPPEGAPVPFRRRHVRRLSLIREAIDRRRIGWAERVLRRWLEGPGQ